MATLTDPQKQFIVRSFAGFCTPTEVVDGVKEVFGVELDRAQAAYYDPTASTGGMPAAKWCELFERERAVFLKELEAIPIFHQAYRLRQLQKLFHRALQMGRGGNVVLAMDILKQAAEETGGKFTNHHVVDGKLDHDHQVSGVMRVSGEVSLRDWAGLAREQQKDLQGKAKEATEKALPHFGKGIAHA